MSLTVTATFPEIWTRKVIRTADDAVVIKPRCNTRYEGEIKKAGDTVNVATFPSVFTQTASVGVVTQPVNYTRSTDMTAQTHTVSTRALLVNQDKALMVDVDDIDEVQSNLDLINGFTKRFAYSFARDMD